MEMVFRQCVQEAKDRGQTVFLSSHILSEVEALCDRVGILRNGHLVEEGTLAQLRHLSAQTVEVTFEGTAPAVPDLPGVRPRGRSRGATGNAARPARQPTPLVRWTASSRAWSGDLQLEFRLTSRWPLARTARRRAQRLMDSPWVPTRSLSSGQS